MNRSQKGQILYEQNKVAECGNGMYQVQGSKLYVVTVDGGYMCECPDNEWRGAICKHIEAVKLYRKNPKPVEVTTQ